MVYSHRIVTPGYRRGTLFSETGEVITPPQDWSFLPAGDSAITRRVKHSGETWVVQVKKGRRLISTGIWAPASAIAEAKDHVNRQRSTDAYARRRKYEAERKGRIQREFEDSLRHALLRFLAFHPRFECEAEKLADRITAHAAPVGSGTVARASSRSLEYKAEAAVMAWLRHHTTVYDTLTIPRIRGRRKEVRRALALQSRKLLERYRQGLEPPVDCPLQSALARTTEHD